MFPNSLFGDLSLVIKVNPNALVWSSTDPRKYIVELLETRCDSVANNEEHLAIGLKNIVQMQRTRYTYDRRFTQMKVTATARGAMYIGGAGVNYSADYLTSPLKFDPDVLVTRTAVSTIMGFSLNYYVKQALDQYYASVPFVVPGERIFIQSFSTGPSASGLNCAMNIPLVNAKEVIALFPRSPNDLTCFRNPEYHHLMITMLNRNFPQKGCNSNSTEFYRMELESCNLDTILCPTQSFENSYLKKVCPYCPMRQCSSEDDTDFLMIFNLERQSANAFFADPVNSTNESITLTGSPQAQGIGNFNTKEGGGDVYYYLNSGDQRDDVPELHNHTAPILAVVSDTFWLFTTTDRPVYETATSWNDNLAKNFPDIFNRLIGRA
jgi:hypothetical protein